MNNPALDYLIAKITASLADAASSATSVDDMGELAAALDEWAGNQNLQSLMWSAHSELCLKRLQAVDVNNLNDLQRLEHSRRLTEMEAAVRGGKS